MRNMKLVIALTLAVLGASAIAEAGGQPGWVPPSNPPDSILSYVCSLLPSGVASYLPFCAE